MTKIISSAQMRAIEAEAIATGRVTGAVLMERAGRAVVAAAFECWPDLGDGRRRGVVLCGPGNNGGDGYVIARILAGLGWSVSVRSIADPARLPADARENHDLWVRSGGTVSTLSGPVDDCDLLVDALFGIGLSRPFVPLAGLAARAVRVLAVDVPSGLDADTGAFPDCDFRADLTVTFHRAKTGHFLGRGPDVCGRLVVADIGLDGPDDGLALVSAPAGDALRKVCAGHKFRYGHALVLSGRAGRGGAARLAARGALRIGAGVVTVGCTPDAVAEHAARLDAVMVRPVADSGDLVMLLGDARINALCLGPALGTGLREARLVSAALAAQRATVLDADALTLLSRDAGLFSGLHHHCVLTPHDGEFARLFPDLAAKLDGTSTNGTAMSKVDAVRDAAARAGCVVLFKGADTVIAGPDGRCAINSAHYERAAPWLATAGSGDVLAGFIAGLLARGFSPFDAACTGAWLHVDAALEFGPALIAEDLPEQLPAVFRRLGV